MRKLVIGNWKMNGSILSIRKLCEEINICTAIRSVNVNTIICVPSIYLDFVCKNITSSSIGVQNISEYSHGPYTGEVSASMVADFDCKYVIVGHSERRLLFHETNDVISQKFQRIVENNLIPILCIGETFEDRENGSFKEVLKSQLLTVFSSINCNKDIEKVIIAYEPVWAIGSGISATLQQIQEAHVFIYSVITNFDEKLAKKLFLYMVVASIHLTLLKFSP